MTDSFYYFKSISIDSVALERYLDRLGLYSKLEIILQKKDSEIPFVHSGRLEICEEGQSYFQIDPWSSEAGDSFENMEELEYEFDNNKKFKKDVYDKLREFVLHRFPDEHPDKKILLGFLLQTVWK